MPYEERTLLCRECGKQFVWTAGAQEFFASKGYTNSPSRCKDCNYKRKAQMSGGSTMPHRREFEMICSNCGKPGTVPFDPSTKKALLCADCFVSQRTAKTMPKRSPVVVDNAVELEKA